MNQQIKHKLTQNIGWIVLLFSAACVLVTYIPYVYTERISDEIWTFRFAYAFALLGIFPTGLVFYADELLLKSILDFKKKKVSNRLAIFYGFTTGLALILIAIPLLWKLNNSILLHSVSFSEFLFPKSVFYFFDFKLQGNPFIMPNIMNIISSPYMGWKINKAKSIETTLVTKE